MHKVKGFTFNPETDKELIDYIDRQPNGSKYILSLVRKDMEQNDIEGMLRRLMDEHMKKTQENPPKTEG